MDPSATLGQSTGPLSDYAADQLEAIRMANREAEAFAGLYDTVAGYFFARYGYPRSVAVATVSQESVREACAVPIDVTPSRIPIWVVDNNCTLEKIGQRLTSFVRDQEFNYFLYYVAIAVPLITLAIAFNSLAVVAVCRIRKRQPRHVIAISLSVSDVLLSTTTLVKRCGAVQMESGPLSNKALRDILHQEVNVLWQAAFAMSALGLVCLAADNFVAVAAPFSYGQFSSSSWFIGVMPCLWASVLAAMVGLRLAGLNYSSIVQYVVAAMMCTLLFVILSAYGFTCFQALLFRRRSDRWAQPEQKVSMRRRLLKGFFTTTLLVLTCLLSWGPLVCYLLVDEEVATAAHPVFLKFLLFCLVMFHLGAVLNPVIYSLRIRGIRLSLFEILNISPQSRPPSSFHALPGARHKARSSGSTLGSLPLRVSNWAKTSQCETALNISPRPSVTESLLEFPGPRLAQRLRNGSAIDESEGPDDDTFDPVLTEQPAVPFVPHQLTNGCKRNGHGPAVEARNRTTPKVRHSAGPDQNGRKVKHRFSLPAIQADPAESMTNF